MKRQNEGVRGGGKNTLTHFVFIYEMNTFSSVSISQLSLLGRERKKEKGQKKDKKTRDEKGRKQGNYNYHTWHDSNGFSPSVGHLGSWKVRMMS